MSFFTGDTPKRMAMPRMVSNELLEMGKDKQPSTGSSSKASDGKPVGKKLTKKEQAKADAKKASTVAITVLLSKDPTLPRVREFLEKRIKDLTAD